MHMKQKRQGLRERWNKQRGEQKAGGVEIVHGVLRKEKTIGVIRHESYRYGERRKRWSQQYGVYQEQPIRGRALGTKRGRSIRDRRQHYTNGTIWEKRELGIRRYQNERTPREIDRVKRRDRQQKRVWNVIVSRRKERERQKRGDRKDREMERGVVNENSRSLEDCEGTVDEHSSLDREIEDVGELSVFKEEEGRYQRERVHRLQGYERVELQNVLRGRREERPKNRGVVFGPEGNRQQRSVYGGERRRKRKGGMTEGLNVVAC